MDQTTTRPKSWEQAKAVMMSVVVGALVSIITILFQLGLELLKDIPTEVPGALAGMIKYLRVANQKWLA